MLYFGRYKGPKFIIYTSLIYYGIVWVNIIGQGIRYVINDMLGTVYCHVNAIFMLCIVPVSISPNIFT